MRHPGGRQSVQRLTPTILIALPSRTSVGVTAHQLRVRKRRLAADPPPVVGSQLERRCYAFIRPGRGGAQVPCLKARVLAGSRLAEQQVRSAEAISCKPQGVPARLPQQGPLAPKEWRGLIRAT